MESVWSSWGGTVCPFFLALWFRVGGTGRWYTLFHSCDRPATCSWSLVRDRTQGQKHSRCMRVRGQVGREPSLKHTTHLAPFLDAQTFI